MLHNELFYHPCKYKGYKKIITSLITAVGTTPVSQNLIWSNRDGHVRQVRRWAWWFSEFLWPQIMKHQSNEIEMILWCVSTLLILTAFLHLDKIIVLFYFKNSHSFNLSRTARGFTSVQTHATVALWLLASLKYSPNGGGCSQSSKWCGWKLISAATLTDFWNES